MYCSMRRTGEVKVRSNGHTAIYEWKIPDFSNLETSLYYSPHVKFFGTKWRLGIIKRLNGIAQVWLNRYPSTSGTPEPIHFSIQCKTSDGEERGAVRGLKYPEQDRWALPIYPPWRVPFSGGLTLTCSLLKGDPPHATGISRETQTEDTGLLGISILLEHWKKLLLSGTGHDVLIKVRDKQFRAHKHILEARSPVFAAMFGSDMVESAGDSVTIEDCDPDSFGQFLQFVYCGKTDIASVDSALSLYYAGDKYDFPNLKKMCVHFLKGSFSTNTVFDVVSLAVRHDEKELLQLANFYFAENCQEVLRTEEWQRFLLANSIAANVINFEAFQGKSSVHKKRSLSPDRDID